MTITIKPTRFEDLSELITNMRKEDRAEVLSSHGDVNLGVIESFIHSKICETVFNTNGDVVCVYGLQVLGEALACPWMLSTHHLPKVSRAFLRGSKEWANKVNETYPILMNVVDADYTVAVRWLAFVGFKCIRTIDRYGVNPKQFYQFMKIKGE